MTRYSNSKVEEILDERYYSVVVPPKMSMFIKSNGQFLDLGGDTHTDVTELLESRGFISSDKEFHSQLKYMGWLRVSLFMHYVELPKVLPTSEQWSALLEVLDVVSTSRDKYFTVYGFNGQVHGYSLEERSPEEIIKLVKRFYSTGVFYESYDQAQEAFRGKK